VLTHEPLSPSRLRPELGIPDAVDAVVMRAMDKDRARRYQTMAELEHDLERLLAGDQNVGLRPPVVGVAPPVRAAAPKRWPLVLLALAVLAAGVTAALRRPAVAIAPGPRPAPVTVAPAPSAAPSATPSARSVPAGPVGSPVPQSHKVRSRPERHPAKPSVTAPSNPETSESVKRGVLPPASKEGYPDK
jgi:hypothetical protein